MIVKNEESNIRRCLDSIQWCDDIVIVDTGSTDKTMDIIRKDYPKVRLQEFPWEGNYFSKCRNVALKMVKTNFTLIIDADEEFTFLEGSSPETLKGEFLKLPKNMVGCVKIELEDMVKGKIAATFKPARFFSGTSNLRYKSTIHNEPVFTGKAAVCGGIKILHYGYDLNRDESKVKVDRTVSLLKKKLDANSDDFEAMFYLMQIYSAYLAYQRPEKTMEWAEAYYDRLEDMDPGKVRRNIFYSATETSRRIGDFDAAKRWCVEGKKRFSKDLDLNYTILLLGIDLKDPVMVIEGAQSYINRYREMDADPLVQSTGFVFTKKPLNLMNAFHKLGLMRIQEGIQCLTYMDKILATAPVDAKLSILGNVKRELSDIGCESLSGRIFNSDKIV
jgi:glycosyltransferase involved in cell wall biosynthesis